MKYLSRMSVELNKINCMTPEEILEGNVLIDLFMHPNYTRKGDWIWWNDRHGSRNHIDALHYEKHWDILMPVVEKIHEPGIFPDLSLKEGVDVTIFYKACKIEYSDFETEYNYQEKADTKIEAVWMAVVDFIKWYNSQK